MKKNTAPELSAKWWNTHQPDGLGATKDLEKALSDYEAAEAKQKKESSENNLAACFKALTQIESAAKKNQAEAEKLAKTPPKKSKSTPEDYQNTAECLKKVPKVADSARKELESNAKASVSEDEEDDDGAGLLTNEKDYQVYLKKTLNKLKQRSMNFAVGLGKKPNEHRYLFHKSKPGKSLIAAIKEGTDLKKFTWGIAGGHEEKPTTLVLALEGPQAPGLKKKTEKLFKHFKPLPFNIVMLMVEGEEAEDIDDPEDVDDEETASTVPPPPPPPPPKSEQSSDPDVAFKTRLAALLPAIQKAIAEKRPEGEEAKLKASEAGVFARKKQFDEANRILDAIDALLQAVVEPEKKTPDSQDPMSAFTARLKAIKPALDKLVASKTPLGEEAKLAASEAAALARQKAFTAAIEKLAEVERLLQQSVSSVDQVSDSTAGDRWRNARSAWQAAKDTVDAQISTLQSTLRQTGDAQMERIAEYGLHGITKQLQVGLQVALREFDNANAQNRANIMPKTQTQIDAFQNFIDNDPTVRLLDTNPFGVSVTIQTTLGPALGALRTALHT